MVRDVAVIAFAQMPNVRRETIRNEVEMLMPVIEDVRAKAGLTQQDIGFTCSGSTDYLSGQAFSFVSTLDGIGPWPPIQESHVEMDGAWAFYRTDGSLMRSGSFDRGRQVGVWHTFDRSGKLVKETDFGQAT